MSEVIDISRLSAREIRDGVASGCFCAVDVAEAEDEVFEVAIGDHDRGAADETAFLLTRRAAGLRAHRAQWALPGGRCDAGEKGVSGSGLRNERAGGKRA